MHTNVDYLLYRWIVIDCRNKILVNAVDVARGPHATEQKKALEAMNTWKRLHDQVEITSHDEMDVDT